MLPGKKDDAGKTRFSLIPPMALNLVAKLLTQGAEKYGDDNWKHVERAHVRYFDAMQRHAWAWQAGESTDKETGMPHLANLICNALFLLEIEELMKNSDKKPR